MLPRSKYIRKAPAYLRNGYKLFASKELESMNDSIEIKLTSDRGLSFAMSGCGWLTPFYFGLIEKMREAGYITDSSIMAGTSGGSLGALVAVAGIHPREGLQLIKDMSLDKTFRDNIDMGLKSVLPSMLPADITERANGKLHVCVTKLWPSPSGSIISKFDNVDDIIDIVAASCFIPFYSSPGALFTKITSKSPSEFYIDGGVFGFMPSIGDVRCSPFPTRMLRRSPNIFIKPSVFSTPRYDQY
jgi:hypothetical protein